MAYRSLPTKREYAAGEREKPFTNRLIRIDPKLLPQNRVYFKRKMKKLLSLLVIALLLGACEKVPETGNVEITVSYYYNDFIGYRPDVDAVGYLYDDPGARCPDYLNSISGRAINGKDTVTIRHRAKADVNGIIQFNDILSGTYYLMVRSNGRYTYSGKVIDIPEGQTLELVKNFSYLHEFEREPW